MTQAPLENPDSNEPSADGADLPPAHVAQLALNKKLARRNLRTALWLAALALASLLAFLNKIGAFN